MEPLVSVLIPAFNTERLIGATIESALAQTWRKTEIIVVDDGSGDHTLDAARKFSSRTVLVVAQPNQGAAAARNKAFSLCQGDYVQWLDADDLLDPHKIERQIQELDACSSGKVLLSGAWAHFNYRLRKARFSPTALWCDLPPLEWLIRKMGSNLQMQTDNWLVSRELTTAAGPWDTRLWVDDDGEYFCRVLMASDGVHFVPDAKSYYRRVGFNSVGYIGTSNRKVEALLLSMNLHIDYLRSMEDSARTRAACLAYIRTWLPEFYPARLDLVAQLKARVEELGGQFEEPTLSWKYNWLRSTCGWPAARHAQRVMPKLKASIKIAWDRSMYGLERRS